MASLVPNRAANVEIKARSELQRYTLSGVEETGIELGRGGYCRVVEVKYKGQKYAAKYICKEHHVAPYYRKQYHISEIKQHSELDHPNIVLFVGVYFLSATGLPALVMEALPTNLSKYLQQHGAPPTEVMFTILRDVAHGLHYLHSRPAPVLHRDLHGKNILLTNNLHAKICDFGESMILSRNGRHGEIPIGHVGASQYGPFGYSQASHVASHYVVNSASNFIRRFHHEEHLDHRTHESWRQSGPARDIFDYGVVIVHVSSGKDPHYVPSDEGQSFNHSTHYLDMMGPNDPLRDLATDCLSGVPFNRPPMTEILERLRTVIVQGAHKPRKENSSQRLFKEAMQHGSVNVQLTLLLLIGAAGAGKTSAKHLFLGLSPPPIRRSTRLAEEAVRAMMSRESTFVWDLVTLEELEKLIAEAVNAGLFHEHRLPPPQKPTRVPEPDLSSERQPDVGAQSHYFPEHGRQINHPEASQEHLPTVVHSKSQIERNIIRLIESSSESTKLIDVSWLYLVDTGGHPSFREIASLFLHNASAVSFVTKLNEGLCERPTVDWYDSDGKRRSAFTSHLTNQEIFRHSLRGMRSRHPLTGKKQPKIFVVGTHRDLEHTCKETRSEKNSKLLDMFRINKDDLVYYNVVGTDELIFPVNAKNPTEEDQKVAKQFRRAVSKCGETVELPLPWFVLDNYLRQLSDALHRKILSTEECRVEAKKLHMSPEACKLALKELDKINMLFYRPKHLEGLVFCGLQVLLDKISELIECIYKLHGMSLNSPEINPPPAPHNNEDFPDPAQSEAVTADIPLLRSSTESDEDADASLTNKHAPRQHNTAIADENTSSSDTEAQSADTLPDLTEFCDQEGRTFRDYGIININILRKFPSHYVDGLFTPTEFLKLLKAFLVTAPVKKGSSDYIMPCLLREMPLQELETHRQLDPSSPAAPLLLQFPDDCIPAGIFVILITYLQEIADWKLPLTSGKPYRNCVTFSLPTGCGGFVTLIDSFEYLEVHIHKASEGTCRKICSRIHDDLVEGTKVAASRLEYGTLSPQSAFFLHGFVPRMSTRSSHG